MPTYEETKLYESRLNIEKSSYDLLEYGFSIDEVEEFFQGIIEDMREEFSHEHEEDE